MRRDLIIGFVIAAALHSGAAFLGALPRTAPPRPRALDAEPPLLPVPLFQPDPLQTTDAKAPENPTPQPLAPILPDRPAPITQDAVLIPMDPPRPVLPVTGASLNQIPRGSIGTAITIFNPQDVDQTPQPTFQAAPVYPAEMKIRGITGEVLVTFIVDAQGLVQQVTVRNASQREFESAAIQAVLKWKFRPGRKNGKPVAVRMEVPIRFKLK